MDFSAKTVSAECEDPAQQDRVIHSATQCAFATSQLVACARVVAPTIDSPACQDQLTGAAKQVAKAVEQLMRDAEVGPFHSCLFVPNPANLIARFFVANLALQEHGCISPVQ